jgi:hypothetical protein
MAEGGNFWSFSLRRTTHSWKQRKLAAAIKPARASAHLINATDDAASGLQHRL